MQEDKEKWESPQLKELSIDDTLGGALSSPVENTTGHS